MSHYSHHLCRFENKAIKTKFMIFLYLELHFPLLVMEPSHPPAQVRNLWWRHTLDILPCSGILVWRHFLLVFLLFLVLILRTRLNHSHDYIPFGWVRTDTLRLYINILLFILLFILVWTLTLQSVLYMKDLTISWHLTCLTQILVCSHGWKTDFLRFVEIGKVE